MTDQQASQPQSPPPSGNTPIPKPVLTKAIGSAICGLLSIPGCFCFGVPSLILGSLAIWLGSLVRKNFRNSTTGEIANVYAWVGIITGIIGVVLGAIALIFVLITGGGTIGFGILTETSG